MAYHMQNEDIEIYELIQKELARQHDHLELIASENYTFPAVMEAMGSILTNKYAEGYPGKRYYSGCEFVDGIESIAIERAKKLFGCKFANVQPHSGCQANAAVYGALLKPYDKILALDLTHGGHLSHGSKVSITGKIYQSFFYTVECDGRLNYEKVMETAKLVQPKIIVCGFSAYTRDVDFAKFREIANEVGAYLLADIAHVAGLVVAGEYSHPFPHCDIVTSTTHKTLRGPRGGLILCNDEEIASKIDRSVFPGMQGGPLMHVIAGKAIGFKENLKPEWKDYARQVKNNIKSLASVLLDKGFELVSGGTDNHLILVSFLNRDFSGKDADVALGGAGITVNKNTVPGETRSPFVTSGVRLGSPALTSRGMKESEFAWIGEKIALILSDIKNTDLQEKIKKEIKEMNRRFPVYDKAIF